MTSRRNRRRRERRRKGAGTKVVQFVVAGVIVVGGIFGVGRLREEAHFAATDDKHCFVNAPTPARAVLVVDVTDPLAATQDRMVRTTVDRLVDDLPDGGLLMATSITGEAPDQLGLIVETCRPKRDSNRNRALYDEEFVAPLNSAVDALAQQGEAPASPILETLLAAANDPALQSGEGPTTIVVMSDYMQYSRIANFYSDRPALPPPVGEPFTGLTVRMHVFRNASHADRQAAAADAFVRWLVEAGATVEYTPPAWMALQRRELLELVHAD